MCGSSIESADSIRIMKISISWDIENSWLIYAAAVVFVLMVVFISVVLQTIRLMRTNPAKVLKKE